MQVKLTKEDLKNYLLSKIKPVEINEEDYVVINGFSRYRMMKEYPFDVYDPVTKSFNYGERQSRTGFVLGLVNDDGKHVSVRKSRLIASQFMKGFSEKNLLFHINGDKFDNHLENLTTHRSELKNK